MTSQHGRYASSGGGGNNAPGSQGGAGQQQQPPQHHSERQAWRAHACSLLSGEWSGSSYRSDGVETVWAQTTLLFDHATGKVRGEGTSLWQGESVPFEVLGAVNAAMSQVELLKNHRSGSCTHLAFSLDLNNLVLQGQFANGGTCTLHKISGGVGAPQSNVGVGSTFPPLHMHRSLSGGSSTGAPSQSVSPDAPKDLLTFLSYCFGESPGIAAKLHSTLMENEIHDPESLTTLSHEEWKELGVVLGHRSKIKLQLQRFFPHLMKMQAEEGGVPGAPGANGGAVSPTNAQAEAGPGAQPQAYLPHGVYGQQQQQMQSAPGSHYVSASTPLYASSAPQQVQVPLEYMCPITRELMDDPVVASDGHSYDRASISQWLEMKKTSPITGKILASKALQPNQQLRAAIALWNQQQYQQR